MPIDDRKSLEELEERGAADEHHGHVAPVGVYVATYLLLLALLGATFGAYYVSLGPLNNVVAVTIAVAKASLVVLFFMGIYWGTRLTWMWALAGFVWLLIMFGTLGDYLTRGLVKVPGW